jgi:hypothetical protein
MPSPTCDRFVVFLDILGFTDRVFRDEHEKILKDLLSVKQPINEMQILSNMFSKDRVKSPEDISIQIQPITFSDSIILFSGDDSAISLITTALWTQYIVENAISLSIPIKGAIAFGHLTADTKNSLYFGKPLIYAYELQDEILAYSVVLHHTAEQRFEELSKHPIKGLNVVSLNDFFVKYKIPLKKGAVNHYLLRPSEPDQLKESLIGLYNIVSGYKRCYVDNTLIFLDSINTSTN